MLFHIYVREQSSVVVTNMIRRWQAVAVRMRCSVLCRGRLHHTLPDSITSAYSHVQTFHILLAT